MAKKVQSSAVRPGRRFVVEGHETGVMATVDFGESTMPQRDFLYGGLSGVLVQVKTAKQQSKLIIATTSSSKKEDVEEMLLRILPASKVGRVLRCWGTSRKEHTLIKGISLNYMFWRLSREGYC